MTKQQLVDAEHTYLMGTFKRLPVTLVEGHGVVVLDDAGREYLDLVAGVATNVLGHGHPAIVRALTEQAGRLIHTSNHYYTEPQVGLARKLVELSFPSRVSFANGGAEANEAAIKLARKWGKVNRAGAYEIIVTEGAFHGRTLAAVTGGNVRYFAYPSGDYDRETLQVVRDQGFEAAFATISRRLGSDPSYEIDRIGIYSDALWKLKLKAWGAADLARRLGMRVG